MKNKGIEDGVDYGQIDYGRFTDMG